MIKEQLSAMESPATSSKHELAAHEEYCVHESIFSESDGQQKQLEPRIPSHGQTSDATNSRD